MKKHFYAIFAALAFVAAFETTTTAGAESLRSPDYPPASQDSPEFLRMERPITYDALEYIQRVINTGTEEPEFDWVRADINCDGVVTQEDCDCAAYWLSEAPAYADWMWENRGLWEPQVEEYLQNLADELAYKDSIKYFGEKYPDWVLPYYDHRYIAEVRFSRSNGDGSGWCFSTCDPWYNRVYYGGDIYCEGDTMVSVYLYGEGVDHPIDECHFPVIVSQKQDKKPVKKSYNMAALVHILRYITEDTDPAFRAGLTSWEWRDDVNCDGSVDLADYASAASWIKESANLLLWVDSHEAEWQRVLLSEYDRLKAEYNMPVMTYEGLTDEYILNSDFNGLKIDVEFSVSDGVGGGKVFNQPDPYYNYISYNETIPGGAIVMDLTVYAPDAKGVDDMMFVSHSVLSESGI